MTSPLRYWMRPLSGWTTPVIRRKRDVLPVPLRPIRHTRSPGVDFEPDVDQQLLLAIGERNVIEADEGHGVRGWTSGNVARIILTASPGSGKYAAMSGMSHAFDRHYHRGTGHGRPGPVRPDGPRHGRHLRASAWKRPGSWPCAGPTCSSPGAPWTRPGRPAPRFRAGPRPWPASSTDFDAGGRVCRPGQPARRAPRHADLQRGDHGAAHRSNMVRGLEKQFVVNHLGHFLLVQPACWTRSGRRPPAGW